MNSWLDSKTALSWIQNKGEWKQFVRHRVNEILKLTAKEDWAYCSTDENPADLGSRGALASQLKENQLWWCGSSWLTGRPDEWPAMTEAYQTPESQVEEKKSTTVLLTEAERPSGMVNVIDLNNHSTVQRLVQVTAWVKSKSTGRLEANELKECMSVKIKHFRIFAATAQKSILLKCCPDVAYYVCKCTV